MFCNGETYKSRNIEDDPIGADDYIDVDDVFCTTVPDTFYTYTDDVSVDDTSCTVLCDKTIVNVVNFSLNATTQRVDVSCLDKTRSSFDKTHESSLVAVNKTQPNNIPTSPSEYIYNDEMDIELPSPTNTPKASTYKAGNRSYISTDGSKR